MKPDSVPEKLYTAGKLGSHFESQFPHMSSGNNNTPLQYRGNEKKQHM